MSRALLLDEMLSPAIAHHLCALNCGLVLVNSRRFPARPQALGMVVSALKARHESDHWPGNNEAQFL